MAELTEAVAEVAETVAENAMDVAQVSRSLSGRDLGIGFGLGVTLGSATTFFFVRRWLESKYNKIVEEEIDAMRDHFRSKVEERAKSVVVEVHAEEKPDLERIVQERGYVPPPPGDMNIAQEVSKQTAEEIVEIVKNVFDETWDYEAELAARSSDKPYVIHVDEFKEGDYISVSLTYFEGDDILCDEHNKPVDNKELLVGEDNLSKFGHGSKDPHIVYIRNDKLSLDMELIKSEGSFVEEIHGLKHSDRRSKRIRFHEPED